MPIPDGRTTRRELEEDPIDTAQATEQSVASEAPTTGPGTHIGSEIDVVSAEASETMEEEWTWQGLLETLWDSITSIPSTLAEFGATFWDQPDVQRLITQLGLDAYFEEVSEPAAPTAEAEAGQEAAAEDRAQPSEIAEGSAPAAETAAAQTDTVPELQRSESIESLADIPEELLDDPGFAQVLERVEQNIIEEGNPHAMGALEYGSNVTGPGVTANAYTAPDAMISASNELAGATGSKQTQAGVEGFGQGFSAVSAPVQAGGAALAVLDAGRRFGDAAMNLRRGDLDPSESRNHGSNAKTAAADLVQAGGYGATAGTGAASAVIGISGASAATTASVAAASTAAAPVGLGAAVLETGRHARKGVRAYQRYAALKDLEKQGLITDKHLQEILAYAQRKNRTMAKIQGALTVGGTAAATSAGVGIAMAAGATVASGGIAAGVAGGVAVTAGTAVGMRQAYHKVQIIRGIRESKRQRFSNELWEMAKDESQGGRARREQALQLIKALGITQQQATGRDGAKVIAKKLRNNAF